METEGILLAGKNLTEAIGVLYSKGNKGKNVKLCQ